MAVLTVVGRSPYMVRYTITDIMEPYIDTARVQIFDLGSVIPLQTTTFSAADVSHVTKIVGYFTGLEPYHFYKVEEKIYDAQQRQTSSQQSTIITARENKDILNTCAHSINFLTSDEVYNTFENLGLIPANRPSIAPPPLKSKYVDLPAADGILDYTELLIGKVPFGRRTGSWTFYTDEQKMESLGFTWDSLYDFLLEKLHGQKVQIMLDDDQGYFYKGRITINQWRSSKVFSNIVIEYNCESYKYSCTSSDDVDWQWDTAIEDPDFTILYGSYSTQNYKVLNFINSGSQETVPIWEASGTVNVKVNFGDVVQDVILGKYGVGQDRKDNLNAAGFCWQMVQNAVNEALGSSSRVPVPYDDPNEQERIAYTEAAKSQGRLDTGEAYTLIQGTNQNNQLSLKPGDNVVVNTSDLNVNVHAQSKEAGL